MCSIHTPSIRSRTFPSIRHNLSETKQQAMSSMNLIGPMYTLPGWLQTKQTFHLRVERTSVLDLTRNLSRCAGGAIGKDRVGLQQGAGTGGGLLSDKNRRSRRWSTQVSLMHIPKSPGNEVHSFIH